MSTLTDLSVTALAKFWPVLVALFAGLFGYGALTQRVVHLERQQDVHTAAVDENARTAGEALATVKVVDERTKLMLENQRRIIERLERDDSK